MIQHTIKRIRDLGQSIWLDFFNRNILDNGALKNYMEEDGISGITSNPSIFEDAILHSNAYDDEITRLSEQHTNNEDIFYALAIEDIRRAADFFKLLYEKTGGLDGLVSIEVSPHLAHDTEGTIQQAKTLWQAINRKNVMIKIPATLAGLPAIQACTAAGMNINITLLFGLPRYKAVTEAYISGLEERVKANLPINHITSVASFFLSRIDVLLDPILEEKKLSSLKGEVAIASAKEAYRLYKDIFFSPRFKKLEDQGARRQHLLWASTSSKDPAFSDVKYVEALIGKETINTLPLKTIAAFNDHGKLVSNLEKNLPAATTLLETLAAKGIDLDNYTQQLEDEGIAKFNKAYSTLLETISHKIKSTV